MGFFIATISPTRRLSHWRRVKTMLAESKRTKIKKTKTKTMLLLGTGARYVAQPGPELPMWPLTILLSCLRFLRARITRVPPSCLAKYMEKESLFCYNNDSLESAFNVLLLTAINCFKLVSLAGGAQHSSLQCGFIKLHWLLSCIRSQC